MISADKYAQYKKFKGTKFLNDQQAAEVAEYEAETAKKETETKTAADKAITDRQAAAATMYKDEVDATLDPVANDFITFAQNAQVTSNVDPAFRNYQLGLAAQLQAQANGEGPSLAQMQLQQSTDQTMNQSLGAIRSATGANAGLSARTAALSAAQGLGAAGLQSGLLRLQEQQQAQQMLGQVSGQGRSGDLDANDAAIQAQIATGQFKMQGLQGLAGIRTQQAAPAADVYGSNATDTRQAVQIKADADAAAIRAAEQRAADRRAARASQNSQIWGTVGTVAGAAAGSFLGPAGTAAGAQLGNQAGQSYAKTDNIA